MQYIRIWHAIPHHSITRADQVSGPTGKCSIGSIFINRNWHLGIHPHHNCSTYVHTNMRRWPTCSRSAVNDLGIAGVDQACAQMHLHLQMQVQMRHLHLHLHLIPSRRMHLHLHLHLIHPHLYLHLHLIQMHLIESNAHQMRIKCEPIEITPECS